MTFRQIMQTPGSRKEVEITYTLTIGGTTTTYTIPNDDIVRVKQYFNADLTGSIMQCGEIELQEKLNDNLVFDLTITAIYGVNTATKTFKYRVKDSTYMADTKTYVHNVCDLMLDWMVKYEALSNVSYPCTIQTFFTKLCNALSYTTTITLPNQYQTLESDIYDGLGMSYRDVLDDICRANGIRVYRDGFEIKQANLGTTAFTIDDDVLMNNNIQVNEHYGPINTITLSRVGLDNAYYPTTLPSPVRDYVIQDNQMLNGDDRLDYAQQIYTELNGIEYDTYDIKIVPVGLFDPLEQITISTGGNSYSSYVFNDEITYEHGGAEETIYATLPKQTQVNYQYATPDKQQDREAKIIVDKLNQELSLEGKTINLTADDIKITSTNFSVDENGNMNCTSGTFSGDVNTSANIKVGDNLYVGQNQTSTYANTKYIYFSGDTYIARQYISGNGAESIIIHPKNTLALNGSSITCQQIARGTITLYGNTDTYQSYGKTFTGTPTVILTSCHNGDSNAYVGNVTVADQWGFRAYCSGGGSTGITFNWVAIGIN